MGDKVSSVAQRKPPGKKKKKNASTVSRTDILKW